MGARSALAVVGFCTGGNHGATATNTSAVLTTPATSVEGDDIVVIAGTNTNTTITLTGSTTVTGINSTASNNFDIIFRKRLTAAEAGGGTVTINFGAAGRCTAAGVVVRGGDIANLVCSTVAVSADPTAATAPHSDECISLSLISSRSASAASAYTAPTGYTTGQASLYAGTNPNVATGIASRNAGTTADESVNPATWAETSASNFLTYTMVIGPMWAVGWGAVAP